MIREIDEPNTDIKAPSNVSQIEAISFLHIFNYTTRKSISNKQRQTTIKAETK